MEGGLTSTQTKKFEVGHKVGHFVSVAEVAQLLGKSAKTKLNSMLGPRSRVKVFSVFN
jgi:hypothetical protein